MNFSIRPMVASDKETVLTMMRTFYTSPAVLTSGSEEIFNADIDNCVNNNPYLEGYIFETDGEIAGYGMLAKSFSTEFGKMCIWIEDLYVKEPFRSAGIGSAFLAFVEKSYPRCLLRLEAEAENEHAIHVYQKCGFEVLPYLELKK